MISLWPYEEVEIEVVSENEVDLNSPWYAKRFQLAGEVIKLIPQLLEEAVEPISKARLWSAIFQDFAGDPLFYILPRKTHEMPTRQAAEPTESPALPLQFRGLANLPSDSAKFISIRTWDVASCIAMATVPGTQTIDPLALFSILRRFHKLDQMEHSSTEELYRHIRSLVSHPTDFKAACHYVSTQVHEVTKQCESILSPALAIACNSQTELNEFMVSERGHDRIIGLALKRISGETMMESQVDPITQFLLNTFRHSAETDFLSFCFAISVFEQTTDDGRDPFGDVIREGGMSDAADLIQSHFNINENENHENVAMDLLRPMPAISIAQAKVTIEIAETLSRAFNRFCKDQLIYIQSHFRASHELRSPKG